MISGALLKIADQVHRIRRRKRLARTLISDSRFPLRAGRWIIGPQFSRHASVQSLPPPLDSVKQWGGWRRGTWLKRARDLLTDIVPPWGVQREDRGSSVCSCDVVLINRMKRPVGFDLLAGKVVREAASDERERLRQAHSRISALYPCVPFEVDEVHGLVIEPMLKGHAFHAATAIERARALELFLHALVAADPEDAPQAASDKWRRHSHDLIRVWVGDGPDGDAVLAGVDAIVAKAKWCWTHGDLFAENIIVTSSGPIVIDYDKADVAPAFTEVMTLAVFEARNLRSSILEGLLWGEHGERLMVLGALAQTPSTPSDKRALFFAWLGWKTTLEDFDEINLRRYVEAAEKAINDSDRS